MVVLAYLGAVRNKVREERNAYRCLFLRLTQYGITVKCLSFRCKDLFVTFLKCMFILMSFCTWTVRSVRVGTRTCNMPGTADAWITDSAVPFGLYRVGSKCVWQYGYKKKPYRPRQHGTYIRTLTYIHQNMKTFLLRVTETQVTLLTQTSRTGLTTRTVSLLCL